MAFPKRSLASGVLAFAMGFASAQMYCLLVYVQLVLLTPVLFKLLSRNRFLVYATTPVCLLLRELVAFAGIELPQIQVLCPMWLIFYVVGLDWKRWSGLIEGVPFSLALCRLPVWCFKRLQVSVGIWLAISIWPPPSLSSALPRPRFSWQFHAHVSHDCHPPCLLTLVTPLSVYTCAISLCLWLSEVFSNRSPCRLEFLRSCFGPWRLPDPIVPWRFSDGCFPSERVSLLAFSSISVHKSFLCFYTILKY